MHDTPPLGHSLPGLGQALRATPQRSALALAAMASVALCGCQQAPALAPAAGAAIQVSLSQPASLRGALRQALQHLDRVRTPVTSEPFHLVAFKGDRLDEVGRSVPAAGSGWTFTFSRYNAPAPSAEYDVVEIGVPGTGYTTLGSTVTRDPIYSPIEQWDALLSEGSKDSNELIAPMAAKGVATNGATMSFNTGVLTIQAGGKSTTYKSADGSYTPIQ